MNIITEKENTDRLTDGINTILSIPEEEFELLIKELQPNFGKSLESMNFYYLTDGCECPNNAIKIGLEQQRDENGAFVGRGYYGGQKFSINEVLKRCSQMVEQYDKDSSEYIRLNRVLHSRDLDSLKSFLTSDTQKKELVNRVFEILSDNDLLSSFIEYDNHLKDFCIEGQVADISEYLKIMGNVFGNVDKSGELSNALTTSDFFITNIDVMQNNYIKILSTINMERYVNHAFTFQKMQMFTDKVIRVGEEPDWNLNQEIHESVFNNMPTNLSAEEKALYVYCKMCSVFSYDEGYLYKDKLQKINYESDFSKEHLESLRVGSKITCYDFSRIYVKLVDELGEDITPVMILTGANEGHALAGFYTKKASATLEAVNISSNNDVTNDLMKAKNGIKLNGVKIISDKDGLIDPALQKVSQMVFGSPAKTIKEFVQELKSSTQEEEVPNDIALKIESFIDVMKACNIAGNEFTQTFLGLRKSKYFGEEPPEMAYLGERIQEEKESHYKRHILLRPSKITDEKDCFMIDTDSLRFSFCSSNEIIEKLNNGQLIYEDEKHKLSGIDKGESR